MSYRLEAVGVWLLVAIFRALPLDAASFLGGWLARRIGPLTGAHRTAVENLRHALPALQGTALQAVLKGMWDNIGRTAAEYPHLKTLMVDNARIEIIDPKGVAKRLKDDGIGGVLVGMHYGNWELSTIPGFRQGIAQHIFFRAPNNPYVDAMLKKLRSPLHQNYLAKGAEGGRQAINLFRKGAHIGMLVDQKLNEGLAAPFFGRDAMTTSAPATFARRLDIPIVTDRVMRLKGARFRIYVEEVEIAKTEDQRADILATTKQINGLFEAWIREDPSQWFWVHRRWPK